MCTLCIVVYMNAMALIHTVPTIFLMPPLDKLKQLHQLGLSKWVRLKCGSGTERMRNGTDMGLKCGTERIWVLN